jgi:hypothetical protein
VPNPQRKTAQARLRKARATLARAEAAVGAAAADNVEAARPTMRGFKIANATLTAERSAAQAEVQRLEAEVAATPTRAPLASVRPSTHPRPRCAVRGADRHRDHLPRHRAHPALLGETPSGHRMNYITMSGALDSEAGIRCVTPPRATQSPS